ncbi:DUF4382 domain-containing protein [Pseudofulvibacter geojedonensis]|uniref:DUF4382 domain-containing protein n=2 Tax=Pseudofulvibacter geojedonensis TaxID=1123758 RepID=A0ABW3I162_9FLAO
MKMFKKNLILKAIVLFGLLITSCSNDDNSSSETAEAKFYITDAPTDNSNVSAVVVTIADLRVNNVSVENFTRTTIDLMQYQNGVKKLLGDLKLQTGTHSNIELVLDYQFDASGNAPGCYVELTNGAKDALNSTVSNISINDTFNVIPFANNNIILDFDIRKAIVSSGGDFELVTTTELQNSVRVVNEGLTGKVSGIMTDAQNTSDMIIAYAYKAGTFNAEVETQGQGSSNVMFSNAVTSSVVSNTTAQYELNFLPEGEYELHFASYSDNNGEFEFSGRLEVESNSEISFNNVQVTSNSSIIVSGAVTGTF